MLLLALSLNLLLLTIALFNFATMRRISRVSSTSKSVAVLLPVRNEAENIERILNELSHQAGLTSLRIIVINDNSEDATLEIAQRYLKSGVEIINAPEPQPGWIGKVSALQTGYHYLNPELPEVIISVDADVSFHPDAIARAVATLDDLNLDFISPYPRQIAITWAERLAQPLLQWSWISTVILRGAERFPRTSTVICNGQFLVMRGAALAQISGFSSVSKRVLDDIELGRSFVRAGFRGVVVDGSEIAATRMYKSFKELRAGYGKSLHTAFGSALGALTATAFFILTGIIPLIATIAGEPLGVSALIAILATRAISALASATRVRDALLHPFSSLFFIYLLYYSWRNRRTAQWKGRTL